MALVAATALALGGCRGSSCVTPEVTLTEPWVSLLTQETFKRSGHVCASSPEKVEMMVDGRDPVGVRDLYIAQLVEKSCVLKVFDYANHSYQFLCDRKGILLSVNAQTGRVLLSSTSPGTAEPAATGAPRPGAGKD
ncbi:MAG: hypothetical protein IT373_21010 [Polyangiaceae bacterium]|nr:hypothetical protein [Polyangiaceae bacterium]